MAKTKRRKSRPGLTDTILIETAWEVCNQVGGIYTVIRSKIPAVIDDFGDNYFLLGPLVNTDALAEIEEVEKDNTTAFKVVKKLREQGYEVLYGRWLVIGRPIVVLLKPEQNFQKIKEQKQYLADKHGIEMREGDDLYNQVIAFSIVSQVFLTLFNKLNAPKVPVTLHCHEWMSTLPILQVKDINLKINTVFTTHATLLGRYLAMNDPDFYKKLPHYDWKVESDHFNITPMVQIERKGAELTDVFTTVSDVTGRECKYLLGKQPRLLLPNGLNIKRFAVIHEVQNLHQKYKEEIHDFVMGHFFQSYTFNLNKVLYFFTSGRYEYHNKGFDITLDALKMLNKRLIKEEIDTTVVMFFVTKRPYWSINPDVLESRGVMEEIKKSCDAISDQIKAKLFRIAASSEKDHRLPDLNKLIDDYWRLRYRRTLQSWKGANWPIIVTHNLVDDMNDEILYFLRKNNMINSPDDKVKVVYHPDFINPTNPLFGIEYADFVRGCHLGVFPSYYEPWGYTPLESIALGVPTITSDLSGFGDYLGKYSGNSDEKGAIVLKRYKKSHKESAQNLAEHLYNFTVKSRRDRIALRNKSEDLSETFDWYKLIVHYMKAYRFALGQQIKRK